MTRSRLLVGLTALALATAACQNSQGEPVGAPSPSAPDIAVAVTDAVLVRDSGGGFSTIAAVPADWRVGSLVWSADATRLAWLATQASTGRTRVVEGSPDGGRTRQWDCPRPCGAVGFHGDDVVSDGGTAGTVLRYGSAAPLAVRPSGLPAGDVGADPSPVTLLAGDGDALYVATATTVYRIDADGTAAGVHDTGTTAVPSDGALSPDGTQLAYTVGGTVTDCPAGQTVIVVDLASGQGTPVSLPSAARPRFVTDVWFDDAGTAYASIVDGTGPCTAAPADGPTATAAAQVYRRDGTSWTSTGALARRGADLGGGRTVLLTGPLTVGPDGVHDSPPGELTLADSTGSDQVLSRDVTAFAVAPR